MKFITPSSTTPSSSDRSAYAALGAERGRGEPANRGSERECGSFQGGSGGVGCGVKKCTHCGLLTHTIDTCQDLHRKPALAN